MSQKKLATHLRSLKACKRCPQMHKPVVTGGPVMSKVILVGQAPGVKEPLLGRPFAWTAGKTMFRWFEQYCGMDEENFRTSIYMAAVCRCFPGKNSAGGDRVPNRQEIANCSEWLHAEIQILKPALVIPVGKLAIAQFMAPGKLVDIIGRIFPTKCLGHTFDLVPLPHPSGASPWHRVEPGKTLVRKAMTLIRDHPAFPPRTV